MTVDEIEEQHDSAPAIIDGVVIDQDPAVMVGPHQHGSMMVDNKRCRSKKSRGPFGFFRAISTVLITGNDAKNKKPPPIKTATTKIDEEETNDTWKHIVGSMRPLHLQQGLSSSSPDLLCIPNSGHYAASSPSPSFSSGTMSQYASASNLVALGEEMAEDPHEVFDAITGDEMIDSKADEFIARFYSQVKVNSRHHRTKTTQF